MVRLIMHGCNGRMGQMISDICKSDPDAEIVAGIDICDDGHQSYPVFSQISDCDVEADVIIDFSTPKIISDILAYSKAKKVPAVLCTTGYSKEQLAEIEAASKETALLKSANMSLGINTLIHLLKNLATLGKMQAKKRTSIQCSSPLRSWLIKPTVLQRMQLKTGLTDKFSQGSTMSRVVTVKSDFGKQWVKTTRRLLFCRSLAVI